MSSENKDDSNKSPMNAKRINNKSDIIQETKSTKVLNPKEKIEQNRNIKASKLLTSLSLKIEMNLDFGTAFLTRVALLLGHDDVCMHIEALTFILENKPQDLTECYHLLNMFCISNMMRDVALQVHTKAQTPAIHQEYLKVSIKSANEYSKGMLTLKAYRHGINITNQTNNVQNNTLNQVNINAQKHNKKNAKQDMQAIENNKSITDSELLKKNKVKVL